MRVTLLLYLFFHSLISSGQIDVPIILFKNGKEINIESHPVQLKLTTVSSEDTTKVSSINSFKLSDRQHSGKTLILEIETDKYTIDVEISRWFRLLDPVAKESNPRLLVIFSSSVKAFNKTWADSLGYAKSESIEPIVVVHKLQDIQGKTYKNKCRVTRIQQEEVKNKKWKAHGYHNVWSGEGGLYLVLTNSDTLNIHAILMKPNHAIWLKGVRVEGVYLLINPQHENQAIVLYTNFEGSTFNGEHDVEIEVVKNEYKFTVLSTESEVLFSGSCKPHWHTLEGIPLDSFTVDYSKRQFLGK